MIVVWAITTVVLLRFHSSTFLTLNKLFLVEDIPPCVIPTSGDVKEWDYLFHYWQNETADGIMLAFLLTPSDQNKMNMKHQNRKLDMSPTSAIIDSNAVLW